MVTITNVYGNICSIQPIPDTVPVSFDFDFDKDFSGFYDKM